MRCKYVLLQCHRTHPNMPDQNHTPADNTASNLMMMQGALFGETEGFQMAIQKKVEHRKIIKKNCWVF